MENKRSSAILATLSSFLLLGVAKCGVTGAPQFPVGVNTLTTPQPSSSPSSSPTPAPVVMTLTPASVTLAATNAFTPLSTPSSFNYRSFPSLVLQPGGTKVMIFECAGYNSPPIPPVQLIDLLTGNWSAAGASVHPRTVAAFVVFSNGKILVAGGDDPSSGISPYATAEIYDPAQGTWTATGSLTNVRDTFSMAVLQNGKVLAVGGDYVNGLSVEIYNPALGTWSATTNLGTARIGASAVTLQNGKVLVTGGQDANTGINLKTTEIFDPNLNTWTPSGSMTIGRLNPSGLLLTSGQFLTMGGYLSAGVHSKFAETYNPLTGTWSSTGGFHTATESNWYQPVQLANGKVFAITGADASNNPVAEIYDPISNTWTVAGATNTTRGDTGAVLLPDGRVLVAFGTGASIFSTYSMVQVPVPTNATAPFAYSLLSGTGTLRANGSFIPSSTPGTAQILVQDALGATATFTVVTQ